MIRAHLAASEYPTRVSGESMRTNGKSLFLANVAASAVYKLKLIPKKGGIEGVKVRRGRVETHPAGSNGSTQQHTDKRSPVTLRDLLQKQTSYMCVRSDRGRRGVREVRGGERGVRGVRRGIPLFMIFSTWLLKLMMPLRMHSSNSSFSTPKAGLISWSACKKSALATYLLSLISWGRRKTRRESKGEKGVP